MEILLGGRTFALSNKIFFNFLKNNDFYDAWMEGYKLDNEIADDNVPLDNFFENCETITWLYNGPGILAWIPQWPKGFNSELIRHHSEWRKKYLSRYMNLDEKWMDFVNKQREKCQS